VRHSRIADGWNGSSSTTFIARILRWRAMSSEFLRFYVEERVRRKRAQGEAIAPTALANEIAADLPNYRHMKKRISALVLEITTAINSAEIAAQFVKRRGREPLP
jgi:hypothetical protein